MSKRKTATSLAIVAAILASQNDAVLAQAPNRPPVLARHAAPAGAPNVLVWMLDDVGFAQLSCFGGLVDTPNIDRVARLGLRYADYHTPAICSASRAAFLTGRNPHSVHVGGHSAVLREYPGYDGQIPASAGTVAENLRQSGYVTYALGKWDHLPGTDVTPSGPFTFWPVKQGFDRFYGFLAADTDQWEPTLWNDTVPVTPPSGPHLLNRDLADQAIAMIASRSSHNPRAPFFMYWATGTAHAPHHAPPEWIAHYKGRFDEGWDKARERILAKEIAEGIVPPTTRLAPRPEGMPAWDSLSAADKRLYARQMEVFAGALSYADFQFGRILDALEAQGELDNTLILVTSDNGASAEGSVSGTYNEANFVNAHFPDADENRRWIDKWGGPETYPHYSFGWAVAGNTPFRYYKQTTYEGGIHVPLVLAWPKGIPARGEWRKQFVNVTDLLPTILDAAKVSPAEIVNSVPQSPFEGESIAYSFNNGAAPTRKAAQYYEMYGNKAIWAGGWMAVTKHRTKPWDMTLSSPPNEAWELYDLSRDPGETNDLASANPEKVAELSRLFDTQAKLYNVYPIGNMSEGRPYMMRLAQAEFIQRGGLWSFPAPIARMSEAAAPPIVARSYRMTARITLKTGKESGPIFVQGGSLGGVGLILRRGRPVFVFRGLDGSRLEVVSDGTLARGVNDLELDFVRQAGAPLVPTDNLVSIHANGRQLASSTVRFGLPYLFSVSETFDIGRDEGRTLTDDYPAATPFPGQIANIVFDFNSRN